MPCDPNPAPPPSPLPKPPERGNDVPVALGSGLAAFPENRGFRLNRTSKSAPVGPREVIMDTVAGTFNFGPVLGFVELEKESSAVGPRRSTSYPASTKRPSGGTKESSPGRSFHLFSLTEGWKTGNDMVFDIPPGHPSCSNRSGTPDTLAVNAIVPFDIAERGRPEGAMMTCSVSTMST